MVGVLATWVARRTTDPAAGDQRTNWSRLIEAAGQVEYPSGGTNWQFATVGLALEMRRSAPSPRSEVAPPCRPPDRATSLERTHHARNPPAPQKKRFRLPAARSFSSIARNPPTLNSTRRSPRSNSRHGVFTRSRRDGFRVAACPQWPASRSNTVMVNSQRGQELNLGPASQVTALINATAVIQWALYYPAVNRRFVPR